MRATFFTLAVFLCAAPVHATLPALCVCDDECFIVGQLCTQNWCCPDDTSPLCPEPPLIGTPCVGDSGPSPGDADAPRGDDDAPGDNAAPSEPPADDDAPATCGSGSLPVAALALWALSRRRSRARGSATTT
jgi:uncharacterized protein (TIGR03382 family)